jgi:hypothetical protein
MKKKRLKIIICILVLLLIAINYQWLDSIVVEFVDFEQYETVNVTRVIDGDTIEISSGETVRLLGIDTPERGKTYYNEAIEFLKSNIDGQEIVLEKGIEDRDKYGRVLRHVFLGNIHINKLMIQEGYANPYFLNNKKYEKEFREVWSKCVQENKRLCEKSTEMCASCIELESFDYKEQTFTLYNSCNVECEISDWLVKDEGRRIFHIPEFVLGSGNSIDIICSESIDNLDEIYLNECSEIWTNTGDTLYLRDNNEKLVLYENY